MPTATLDGFLQRLKRAMAAEALAPLPDRELLERFLAAQDEAAFLALLSRHGPMVFRVCRRALPREQDAEDAFQATFVILARQAHTVRKRASLASWLHGVAYRVALEARDREARRRRHETRAGAARPSAVADDAPWREVRSLLDEELGRLSERLRAPLVLCYLEGLTQDEAAHRLGESKSTFRRRLEQGRGVLAARLARRGVALSAALCAPLLAEGAAPAVPPGLAGATLQAAICGRAGQVVAAGVLSARVLALTEGVVQTMWPKKGIVLSAAALVLLCVGSAGVVYRSQGDEPPAAAKAKPAADVPATTQTAAARVKAVLQDAERDAEGINDPFNRAVALGEIARAHAGAGRREAAADVLRKALEAEGREQGQQYKDNRLSILAEYQAQSGDLKGALETIDSSVSNLNRASALRDVATAQAHAGDTKGALVTVKRMPPGREDDLYREEALRQIAVRQAEAGDSKGALATADRIRGGTSDKALVLAAVVAARVKAGDKEGAAKLIAPIRENIPGDGNSRDFGLLALAEAQEALGMAEDALKTAKEIADKSWRDGALGRIVARQAARGDVKAARQTAEAIEDGYRRGDALKEIVGALIRAKDLPGAVKAAADSPHDFGRCYALMELAKAQAAAGRKAEARQALDEALALADRLPNPPQTGGVREAALAHCAGARAAAGDPDGALEWAGKQDDLWGRAMARIRVAAVLAGHGSK